MKHLCEASTFWSLQSASEVTHFVRLNLTASKHSPSSFCLQWIQVQCCESDDDGKENNNNNNDININDNKWIARQQLFWAKRACVMHMNEDRMRNARLFIQISERSSSNWWIKSFVGVVCGQKSVVWVACCWWNESKTLVQLKIQPTCESLRGANKMRSHATFLHQMLTNRQSDVHSELAPTNLSLVVCHPNGRPQRA